VIHHPQKGPTPSARLGMTLALWLLAALANLQAAEVIPPKPAGYFSDYANVVSKEAALRFNEQLAQFERETSNQVVVAVFPKMETDSSIEDYAQRIAQSWGVGHKDRSQGNGVVLLVFIADHKASIQVGYGLEGALPDVTAFDIRSRHINPLFRNGDYEGGLATGIDLILKAIRGEYRGTGKTVAESVNEKSGGVSCLTLIIFVIVLLIIMRISRGSRRGWGYTGGGGPFIGGWGGGGGGWSGGSSSGGGFSGFSGGGGSFGGGGSSGDW
jgi:uncharacterized protein